MRAGTRLLRKRLVAPDADPVAVAVRLGITFQAAVGLIRAARAANDAAPPPKAPAGPDGAKTERQKRALARLHREISLGDPGMATRLGGGRALRGAGWRPAPCQWVEGEPKDRNFCGQPVKAGSSYCAAHHARCYRPATEFEKRLEKAEAA